MFELSVAIKYLTPRWRQLSVSIISLISILVIALVVWLVVVFFSVTNGLTNSWIDKMIALTAPVRVTPTEEYYRSYYYNIDGVSSNSDYQTKSLREKLAYEGGDPYDPSVDEELPSTWPAPDLNENGHLKDLVQEVFASVRHLPGELRHPTATVYEVGTAQLRLLLERGNRSMIEQTVFLGPYDPQNSLLIQSVLPIDQSGIANLHRSVYLSPDDNLVSNSAKKTEEFYQSATLKRALLKNQQLYLPPHLFESPTTFRAIGLYKNDLLTKILVPTQECSPDTLSLYFQGHDSRPGTFTISKEGNFFPDETQIDSRTPAYLVHDKTFPVNQLNGEIEVAFNAQGVPLQRQVPLNAVTPVKYEPAPESHLWFDHGFPPSPNSFGYPILLPKSYREAGVLVGDLGTLAYSMPTASAIQEQRVPVYVAAFYDPGIIPSGGKFAITDTDLIAEIRSAQGQEEIHHPPSTGINIRLADRELADDVKAALIQSFDEKGIGKYWKVETYKEFDFAKDLIRQLGSEKRLFSLLAGIIIIVACSNIISMLIILVNDKKKEIGILRSMGASSLSIMTIFGLCGVSMGVIGSLLGTVAALFTLQYLQELINLISWIQGYEMFNPLFYGDTLPSTISVEAFLFVVATTAGISLLAGIVPAVKACLLKPSATLRSE